MTDMQPSDSPLSIRDAQAIVDEWIRTIGVRYFDEMTNLAQLVEEVGEVARILSRTCGEQSSKPGESPGNLSDELAEVFEQIDDAATRAMATAERAFLAELDGSCRTAMAAQLRPRDGAWHLRGEVLTPDGQTKWTARGDALVSASLDDLAALGRNVASSIRDQAGGDLPVFTD